MNYASQSAQILAYLAKGKSLTHRDAQRLFNCDRLGARIYDLRGDGHIIHAETIKQNGKRFARYSLVKLARKVA